MVSIIIKTSTAVLPQHFDPCLTLYPAEMDEKIEASCLAVRVAAKSMMPSDWPSPQDLVSRLQRRRLGGVGGSSKPHSFWEPFSDMQLSPAQLKAQLALSSHSWPSRTFSLVSPDGPGVKIFEQCMKPLIASRSRASLESLPPLAALSSFAR